MLCFGLLHDAVRLRAPLLGTSPGKKIVSRASILNQFSDQAKGIAGRFQHLDGAGICCFATVGLPDVSMPHPFGLPYR